MADKPSSLPSSLLNVGGTQPEKAVLSMIQYSELEHKEAQIYSISEIDRMGLKDPNVTWIDLDGLHAIDLVHQIGDYFKIHPLVQEDLSNPEHRPKIEDHGHYILVIVKMIYYEPKQKTIHTEQLGMVIGSGYILTFQEYMGDNTKADAFEIVRERLRRLDDPLRKNGADFLAYSMLDALCDNYLHVMQLFYERVENTEDQVLRNADIPADQLFQSMRFEINYLRRCILPTKDVLTRLEHSKSSLITDNTKIYLRDALDHCMQAIELVESSKELLGVVMDTYMMYVSYRMNKIMQTLAVVSTIFAPLTFLVGVYGMNFDNMPEIHSKYGYYFVWGIMILISTGLLFLFKKKKLI